MILIKNGNIYDAVSETPYKGDILIEDSKIMQIGENISSEGADTCIDAAGMNVYPGFVEAHCHMGLDGYGVGFEGQDYCELNDSQTPQLRGIDSVNPMDPTLKKAVKAGVTCVAAGPGSADVLGGTFVAYKPVGVCVDEMVVKNPVAMKCAFGENPKRCYKDKDNYTRMSTASKLRESLFKAQDYKARKEAAGDDVLKRPAFDMKMEALIPVLEKKIPLKAHAHRADDILTAIRIAKEFDVDMTLEHVTEGHLIAGQVAASGFPCAVGPTMTHATKFELTNKSYETPVRLTEAGCQVSIITDSPVIPQEYLPLCAGLAVKAGMKPHDALKAITINPAKHIGIADRVGSLEVGKDADIVIMDGSCFESMTKAVYVIVDGNIVSE